MTSPASSPPGNRSESRQPSDTKSRLLDAASRLFAERGYGGTSMRAVTQAAGVSVSAANYHFGSKQALLLATFGRVITPVNEERLERLAVAERDAKGGAPGLETVLEAFLAPAMEQRSGTGQADRFRQVVARLYSDPPEVVAAFKQENFAPISARFIAVVERALPDRDPEHLALGFQLMVGMMVHVIGGQLEVGPYKFETARETEEEEEARDPLLLAMIRFGAAGLRAIPVRPGAPAP